MQTITEVYNNSTGLTEFLTQEQLEEKYQELKSGELEIVEEHIITGDLNG